MKMRLRICITLTYFYTLYFTLLENVKKINIIDSHDDKTSRLMICNLFYFVDGGLYY